MNYIKVQQAILADILKDTPRGVLMYHDEKERQTMFGNLARTLLYVIPDEKVAVNRDKCKPLARMPFKPCPIQAEYEITHSGELISSESGKGLLLIFKNEQGEPVYIDKKLRDRFDKSARFFQYGVLSTITVVEEVLGKLCTVGYLCPCRPPKNR